MGRASAGGAGIRIAIVPGFTGPVSLPAPNVPLSGYYGGGGGASCGSDGSNGPGGLGGGGAWWSWWWRHWWTQDLEMKVLQVFNTLEVVVEDTDH